MEEGETWALVEAKWFEQWAHYTGVDLDKKTTGEQRGGRPGPIDNSPLKGVQTVCSSCSCAASFASVALCCDPNLTAHLTAADKPGDQLKLGLTERLDFVLLHQDVWDKLHAWYGGGPAFLRKVLAIGVTVRHASREMFLLTFAITQKIKQLELYPFVMTVFDVDEKVGDEEEKNGKLVTFSRKLTFNDVLSELAPEEVRSIHYCFALTTRVCRRRALLLRPRQKTRRMRRRTTLCARASGCTTPRRLKITKSPVRGAALL